MWFPIWAENTSNSTEINANLWVLTERKRQALTHLIRLACLDFRLDGKRRVKGCQYYLVYQNFPYHFAIIRPEKLVWQHKLWTVNAWRRSLCLFFISERVQQIYRCGLSAGHSLPSKLYSEIFKVGFETCWKWNISGFRILLNAESRNGKRHREASKIEKMWFSSKKT